MAGAPQGPVYQVAVMETRQFEASPTPAEEMQVNLTWFHDTSAAHAQQLYSSTFAVAHLRVLRLVSPPHVECVSRVVLRVRHVPIGRTRESVFVEKWRVRDAV